VSKLRNPAKPVTNSLGEDAARIARCPGCVDEGFERIFRPLVAVFQNEINVCSKVIENYSILDQI